MGDITSNHFQFAYAALSEKERKQVEFIKREYTEQTEGEKIFKTLCKLDKKVKRLPKTLAILVGVCGGLLLGLVGVNLAIIKEVAWVFLTAVVGIFAIVVAYPLRQKLSCMLNSKYKPRILELCKKFLDDANKK